MCFSSHHQEEAHFEDLFEFIGKVSAVRVVVVVLFYRLEPYRHFFMSSVLFFVLFLIIITNIINENINARVFT